MGYDCLIRLKSSDISSLIVLILLVRWNKKTSIGEIITLSSFYIEGKYEIKMCVYFVYVLCPVGFDYLLFTVL
jgi:hypothetical protein